MYKLVPALKELSLPGLKKTSAHGKRRTFLILDLLTQLPLVASSGNASIGIDCLNFSLKEDDCGGGREPQRVLIFRIVQSNIKCQLV